MTPAVRGRGKERPGQMGGATTLRCKDGAYWTHKEERSLEAPIRNALIPMPSALTTNVFYSAKGAAKGPRSLPPKKFSR